MHEVNLERYYNRFSDNPQYSDYKQLLFRAGDTLQSAELNELQTTLKNDLSTISKRFIGNGDFISGGNAIIKREDSGVVNVDGKVIYDFSILCEAGIFFANGEYISIPETTLTKSSILEDADFVIGGYIHYSNILEGEDLSLLDPALGSRNYGQPGAGRLKIVGEWSFDDVTSDDNNQFFMKFYIIDGVIQYGTITETDFVKRVTDIIAEYDRESNGNYVVQGYKTLFVSKDSSIGKFNFQITEGKANVNGYKFTKNFTTDFDLPELVDFELRQSEPNTFTADGYYELFHSPIRRVFRINGEKNHSFTMSHGASGSIDNIPTEFHPALRVNSIYVGGTQYHEGTDFVLDNDKINWGPAGNEPMTNTQYTVDLDYGYTEQYPNFSGTNGDISPDGTKISLNGFISGSPILVDYDFVLKRVDTIVLNSNGVFNSTQGVAREDKPLAPKIDTVNNLPIADVLLSGDEDPIVEITGQRVFKMSDIEKLYSSIKDNEYNLSKMALQIDLSERGMDLKNTFVEPFDGDSLRDDGLEAVSGYTKAMSVNGVLTFNVDWSIHSLNPVNITNWRLAANKRFLTIGTTGSVSKIIQPHYTKSRKINEYMYVSPPMATIRVTPSSYKWVDREIFLRFVKSIESRTSFTDKVGTGRKYTWQGRYASWWDHHMRVQALASISSSVSSIEVSEAPSIIPQIQLKVDSVNGSFNNGEQVDIFFNNKLVKTATVNTAGAISDTITVPPEEISGRKLIKVVGKTTGIKGDTTFTATPLTRTNTTSTTRRWKWVGKHDPVAQSFTFEQDTVLDKIKVWFDKAPTTETFFQIVEMTAGFPDTDKTISLTTVPVGDIVDGGSYEFKLEDKVTVVGGKYYAFIVGCDDAIGSVRVAELGERTKNTGIWLTSQANNKGTFFNSSNNKTWSVMQKEDMMFEIFSTTYNSTRDVVIGTQSVTNITDFMLIADADISEGNSIEYKVELLDAQPMKVMMIDAHRQYRFNTTYTGNIRVTALMKSNGKYSPILTPDAQLAIGKTDITSSYTSKGIEFDALDKKIIVYVNNLIETGASYKIQIQLKQGSVWNWVDATILNGKEIGDGWREERHELNLTTNAPDADQTLSRVRIVMNTDKPYHKMFISNLRLNNINI